MAASTDIILGVTRAAGPEKRRAAAARLETLNAEAAAPAKAAAETKAAETKAVADDWEATIRTAAADTTQGGPFAMATGVPRPGGDGKDPYVQFEALLLQNMIEAMMPDDAVSVFGSGTAGKVWKSMLAEKVALEIAQTGEIGIAKQLAADRAETAAANQSSPSTSTKADKA
jgi:peptidoglycan hydrolase FlgJ